jgi:hypothetical protein
VIAIARDDDRTRVDFGERQLLAQAREAAAALPPNGLRIHGIPILIDLPNWVRSGKEILDCVASVIRCAPQK